MREDGSLENVSKNYNNTCWSTGSATVLSAVSPSLTLFHSQLTKAAQLQSVGSEDTGHCAELIWLCLQEDHIGGCGMYRMYRQCLYY